jgi:hypothetical protein
MRGEITDKEVLIAFVLGATIGVGAVSVIFLMWTLFT